MFSLAIIKFEMTGVSFVYTAVHSEMTVGQCFTHNKSLNISASLQKYCKNDWEKMDTS